MAPASKSAERTAESDLIQLPMPGLVGVLVLIFDSWISSMLSDEKNAGSKQTNQLISELGFEIWHVEISNRKSGSLF
jgi:hypothetical protein